MKNKWNHVEHLLFGTFVSSTLGNAGCCCAGGKAENAFWLLLKNVLVDVCDGGVANEKRSSVNNCCCWCTVVCWPLADEACWEKKSVPPKPFPLAVVVVGDVESLF